MAKPEKRIRKANFSEKEVQMLLGEVSLEHTVLFSSHNQTVTQKRKNEIWQKITEKVNSCSVAHRTTQECKDKWKGLKGAVLNRQRDLRKPGGGPQPSQVPFEDFILGIIGRDSNRTSGVADAAVAETNVNYCDSSAIIMGVDTASPVRPSAGKGKSNKYKSVGGKPVLDVRGQEDLVDEWLRSEISKNKLIETHLALRNRKLELQIAVLESQSQRVEHFRERSIIMSD